MSRKQHGGVTNAFAPPQEGYRSVNLKLDYADLGVVGAYLPTHKSVGVLEAIFASLQTDSRERANTLIAPYGSGKSSLLLFLCTLLEAREESRTQLLAVNDKIRRLAPSAAQAIAQHLADGQGYLIVVLTGDEGPLEAAFCTGLQHAFEQRGLKKTWEKVLPARKKRTQAASTADDSLSAVALYRRAAKELTTLGYKGIVVAYDEFGKVLEAQQTHPRPADLFFVQTFAELCSRSGSDQIHLFLSMHQGFLQYAHRLPAYMRNEWTKIEGRFRSFHFVEDSLQVYELIAQAIQRLHAKGITNCITAIEQAVKPYVKAAQKIPAFASFTSEEDLARMLIGGYPLDPLALYVLPRLSARLAQNERTLFHFLLGQETGCLYPLLMDRGRTTRVPFLRAADLFAYFADLMAQDTGVGGTYRRYVEINTVLERVGENDELAQTVVKTIGMLSILNEPAKLPPTEDILRVALGFFSGQEKKALRSALDRLVHAKVLLHRRHNGEYRIWEGSDVDLTSLLRHKKAEYETSFDPVAFLASTLPAPPILAHRYNEKVGITRYFEGSFASVEDLRRLLEWEHTFEESTTVDGRVYYLFAESQPEIDEALRLTQQASSYRQILFAIPRLPLSLFEPLLELYCLEQLLADTDFVSQDPVLQRELSELADDCLSTIQRKVVYLYEPRYQATTWVYQGQQKPEITSHTKLRRLVSDICQDVFPLTPRFHNELINRRRPSVTIVNARKRLIRALLENTGTENLGLTGYGPEVSIFRALLHNTGLYQQLPTEQHAFVGSSQIKDKCLSQTIAAIEEYLHQSTDHPRSFVDLVNQLLSPPFGLRAGVLPVLFAAVFQSFPRPLNAMEDGVFAKELKAELFERMLVSPDKVSVQCVALSDEVTTYLAALPVVFSKNAAVSSGTSERELLQAGLEKIYQWSHQLPSCAMTTQRLSEPTLALRTALVTATDPVALVLHDIPRVYLGEEEEAQLDSLSPAYTERVLEGLRTSVHELDSYKPRVAEEVAAILRKVFPGNAGKQEESLIEAIRQWIGTLTSDIAQYLEDPQCAGFITRSLSNYEDDRTLVESLASLVTGRSIAYWDDSFLRQFELGVLLLYKKIRETDELLKSRTEESLGVQEPETQYRDPSAWTVRLEQGGQMAGELMVVTDSEAPSNIQGAKARIAKILEAKTWRLTAEERKRVLVELLREEL